MISKKRNDEQTLDGQVKGGNKDGRSNDFCRFNWRRSPFRVFLNYFYRAANRRNPKSSPTD